MSLKYYKLRINIKEKHQLTGAYSTLEKKYFERYARATEKGKFEDNPHFHYYLEMFAKASALREYIRRIFGKNTYSLKELDEARPIEYLAYILKEGIYFEHKGFGEDFEILLEEAREYDLTVKKQMAKKSVDKIEFYIFDKCGSFPTDQREVINLVVDYYLDNGLVLRKYTILTMVDTLLVRHNASFKRDYKDRLFHSIL